MISKRNGTIRWNYRDTTNHWRKNWHSINRSNSRSWRTKWIMQGRNSSRRLNEKSRRNISTRIKGSKLTSTSSSKHAPTSYCRCQASQPIICMVEETAGCLCSMNARISGSRLQLQPQTGALSLSILGPISNRSKALMDSRDSTLT